MHSDPQSYPHVWVEGSHGDHVGLRSSPVFAASMADRADLGWSPGFCERRYAAAFSSGCGAADLLACAADVSL